MVLRPSLKRVVPGSVPPWRAPCFAWPRCGFGLPTNRVGIPFTFVPRCKMSLSFSRTDLARIPLSHFVVELHGPWCKPLIPQKKTSGNSSLWSALIFLFMSAFAVQAAAFSMDIRRLTGAGAAPFFFRRQATSSKLEAGEA